MELEGKRKIMSRDVGASVWKRLDHDTSCEKKKTPRYCYSSCYSSCYLLLDETPKIDLIAFSNYLHLRMRCSHV